MGEDTRQVCFVIMGFGKKTDFETGRTLDLDATYEAIIKPAVLGQGLRCIRADEIKHSGVIDTEMYEMLLRSELVIADVSTGNVNAVYELGVRHALRPFSTIVIKETKGRVYFDLYNIATFHYEHLGEDIGHREATRASRSLGGLIAEVMRGQKPDSPVYTYLPELQQPSMSSKKYAELLDETEAAQERLAAYMRAGAEAMKASRHRDAAVAFAAALKLKPGEPFIIQQLALSTYKSRQPSELDALVTGLGIIEALDPERSNDPETLGIAGAMRKRLWLLAGDRVQLDAAIRLYGRGFEMRRDYYNGENLAVCCDFRAAVQADPDEARYDKMRAAKTREAIIGLLQEAVADPSFADRYDGKWVFATLANCSFALGRTEDGNRYEALFMAAEPAAWEVETYSSGKTAALARFHEPS